jgi:predicted nucleic acid-binding protein
MITAVDTNVLLDIFLDDPTHRSRSLAALRACAAGGPIVACEVVWAEICAVFPDLDAGRAALGEIPVAFSPMEASTAEAAGAAWATYRRRGGPRERVVADFLVGAHGLAQADRLLTRDRGFQRASFDGLVIVDPTA